MITLIFLLILFGCIFCEEGDKVVITSEGCNNYSLLIDSIYLPIEGCEKIEKFNEFSGGFGTK